jgi:signal transduction histidine kinase
MLKIQFGAMPEDQELLTIAAHKSMLYIALNNIIDNAFKYSAPHPVVLNFGADAGKVTIAIADEGPGISDADKAKIFRPFYRVNKDKGISGSGIGLYITGKIIELFGGSVKVLSNGFKGSTFVIEFAVRNI